MRSTPNTGPQAPLQGPGARAREHARPNTRLHPLARAVAAAWLLGGPLALQAQSAPPLPTGLQVIAGQADHLGGGVFKKRLHANAYRSIVLARAGDFWVYEYLFAKKDRANIDEGELKGFRMLAKAYAGLTAAQVESLLADEDWIEICREAEAQETAG